MNFDRNDSKFPITFSLERPFSLLPLPVNSSLQIISFKHCRSINKVTVFRTRRQRSIKNIPQTCIEIADASQMHFIFIFVRHQHKTYGRVNMLQILLCGDTCHDVSKFVAVFYVKRCEKVECETPWQMLSLKVPQRRHLEVIFPIFSSEVVSSNLDGVISFFRIFSA